jgi:hypothetical protein
MSKPKSRRAKSKRNKLTEQSRGNQHQQLPQTQAQAEDGDKEQQQVSPSDPAKSWF